MKTLAVAATNLRRTLRVRTNVFFVFVFPMLLILILGLAFGGSGEARVGVVAARPGPLGQALLDGLAATKGIEVRVVAGEARLVSDIGHGLLAGGLVIPADYDATLAAGGTVTVRYVAQSGTSGRQLGAVISAVVDHQAGRVQAARFVAGQLAVPFAQALQRTDAAAAAVALVFGVNWGDPLGAGLLVASFALVASGAGMLLGATARTPEQAIAVGLLLGLGMGALGGTMMPLEFFSPTITAVAHVTPHAWAVDAFAILVRRGGTVLSIGTPLLVLVGTAAVLTGLAGWRMRHATGSDR